MKPGDQLFHDGSGCMFNLRNVSIVTRGKTGVRREAENGTRRSAVRAVCAAGQPCEKLEAAPAGWKTERATLGALEQGTSVPKR